MTPERRCYTRDVLERISTDDIHRAANALPERILAELATLLEFPKRTLTRDSNVARALRRRLLKAPDDYVILVGASLVQACRIEIIEVLGSNAADPTFAQLRDAVEDVIGHAGPSLVALAMCGPADGDFPASAHCSSLLESHPRLMSVASGPVPDDDAQPLVRPKGTEPGGRRPRARTQKPRKEKKRSAPARYRRIARGPQPSEETASDTVVKDSTPMELVSLNGKQVSRGIRRTVRLTGQYSDVDYDDAIVGAVVLVPIRFDGSITGVKNRPCIVVAASGTAHLIVRTCYSEGGVLASDWRSFRICDLEQAGLQRETYVSMEERKVKRSHVLRVFGSLGDDDWNQL